MSDASGCLHLSVCGFKMRVMQAAAMKWNRVRGPPCSKENRVSVCNAMELLWWSGCAETEKATTLELLD